MSGCKFLIMDGAPEKFESALATGAELVCLDLEDTVPEARKASLRAHVDAFLGMAAHKGVRSGVRINPLGTRDGLQDMLMLQQLPRQPRTVLLAKPESPEEVALAGRLLTSRAGAPDLQVIIETPQALARAEAMALVPGVSALVLGGKDLATALRAQRNWDALLYARGRCVAAAALAGIDVYDEPHSPRDDFEGVRQAALRARAMGFSGKSAVDPRHVPIIQRTFQPTGDPT